MKFLINTYKNLTVSQPVLFKENSLFRIIANFKFSEITINHIQNLKSPKILKYIGS
jgi:hypothetical protein